MTPNSNVPLVANTPCPPFGVHTYTVPGTYEITVRHWRVGPADGRHPAGQQSATITVTGDPVHSETTFALNTPQPADGGTLTLPYDAQRLYIDHQPSAVMDLTMQLAWPDGAILTEHTITGIAHDGTTLIFLPASKDRLAETRKVLAGRDSVPAIITLTATDQAGQLLNETRMDITLSALRPQQTTICPFRDKTISVGEETSISMRYRASENFVYQMDWGDGSIEQDVKPAWSRDSWSVGADQRTLKLSHTYSEPGVYEARFRFENKRATDELTNAIDTCAMRVTVE